MGIQLFAHAGEMHTDSYTTTSHLIFDRWYVALALLILLLLIVARLTSLLTKGSKRAIYNVLMFVLLVVGMGTYTKSAVISIVALTIGFTLALFQVLVALSVPGNNDVKTEGKK